MANCKWCGKQFEYNDEVGYYHDICSSMCDGALSQQPKIEKLTTDLAECRKLLREGIGFADMPESCFPPEIDARFVKWCNEAAKAGGG